MKALEFLLDAGPTRRPGDLDLRALELRLFGDLDRAAEAKGDTEPEKASKPVRFVAVGTGPGSTPVGGVRTGTTGKLDGFVLAGGGEEDGDAPPEYKESLLPPPKRLCPFTEANGDDVDAYAMKPLYGI